MSKIEKINETSFSLIKESITSVKLDFSIEDIQEQIANYQAKIDELQDVMLEVRKLGVISKAEQLDKKIGGKIDIIGTSITQP